MKKKWFEKLQKRNEKLLNCGRRYHTVRDILLIIASLSIFGMIGLHYSASKSSISHKLYNYSFTALFFNLLFAYLCHIRAQHIETLAFYNFILRNSQIDLSQIEIPDTSIKQWIQSHNPL